MNEKIIFILVLIVATNSKEITTQFQINQMKEHNGWLYLGKMVLTSGSANIHLTTEKIEGKSNKSGGQIVLNIIPDTKWEEENQLKCTRPILSPIITHELLLDGSISITEHTININEEELYYFVLKDCANFFKSEYTNFDLAIKVNLNIVNNGAYLGEDEDHWAIVPVIISIGLWIMLSNKDFLNDNFKSDPDYAKLLGFGTLVTNMSSLVWRSFGYLIYRNLGVNYTLFHFIYLFMHSMSETLVLTLLILVSMGWSLNFLNGPKIAIAIPILCILLVLNVVFTLMTQLSNKEHDMHHTFDAYSGSLLVWLRFFVGFGFLISILITYQESRHRIKQFLIKFGILGTAFIFAMPTLVFIANSYLPAKDRNEFVFISVEVIKSICNILLIRMLASSQSEYNKLSYRNASFLPNQAGLF